MIICWRYRMPFDANGCVSTLMNVKWIKCMYFASMSLRLGLMIVYFLVMYCKRCSSWWGQAMICQPHTFSLGMAGLYLRRSTIHLVSLISVKDDKVFTYRVTSGIEVGQNLWGNEFFSLKTPSFCYMNPHIILKNRLLLVEFYVNYTWQTTTLCFSNGTAFKRSDVIKNVWNPYILYDHEHARFGYKISDSFADDFNVGVHEISNGFHLPFHLRIKTSYLTDLINE